MPEPVLSVDGLVRRFGDLVAVDDVSFRIEEGETYGLLGPNGAGKTTAISVVAGLLSCDGGEIRLGGQRVGPNHVAVKAMTGLVPQELAIYPDLTGRENLNFFGRLEKLRGAELKRRTDEVLEVIGLADRAGDLTKEYSGGMKRRLNIGIGLLHQPKLLILDEPTVGVDPQSRNSILEAVEALAGEGMSVLYTTHYMEEAERLCDRIGILDHGAMMAEGTRDELLALTGETDRVHLEGTGDLDGVTNALASLDPVRSVANDRRSIDLIVVDAPAALAEIVGIASASGMSITDVEVARPDLESVFLNLTGRALRN
ncbi:MAG: ABC transporter ATP-binding protein [Candidatus Microthrix sp.]|jgi:ABC-2 type transport system ATP-binding protein|nr:ABC transporter ATP-binding protein [Candidatus Microthrix sp.]